MVVEVDGSGGDAGGVLMMMSVVSVVSIEGMLSNLVRE